MMNRKKIVVLSGAGISAESGLKTFRDANGLWENHDISQVATPEAFKENPKLVHRFYNQRRRQLLTVKPNKAHILLAKLEQIFEVNIITQNVDDLHERAGSKSVLHLHGELLKVRPINNPNKIISWKKDLKCSDMDDNGIQLRPHIVWFGEPVPLIEEAIKISQSADFFVVIGTSLQVYPAAGLLEYVPQNVHVYYIDPNPTIKDKNNLHIFVESASTGLQKVYDIFTN